MYLNVDLLYVLDEYLFLLFYYRSNFSLSVYSPITKKSVIIYDGYLSSNPDECRDAILIDHIINNFKQFPEGLLLKANGSFIFTEKRYFCFDTEFLKCKPFKLDKKLILFLKSNKRIK